MLFNSFEFLFAFLPIVLIGYRLLVGRQVRLANAWLLICSLFFYAWWNPPFVLLLIVSILTNHLIAGKISKAGLPESRLWLSLGLCLNLLIIGYFKYWGFLLENLNTLLGTHFPVGDVFLPLGISFFTFQQISYLVDMSRNGGNSHSLLDYALFVTFFPQLIAGPILHHSEILPQLQKSQRPCSSDMAVGITLLSVGLFKKVVIADALALRAQAGFTLSATGADLSMGAAWIAALSYTLQLYFDFSGYSDMALGCGRLFGLRFPVNFFSPYRATNVIDFWQRWHMTLSRFLRDYVYIQMGGSRCGTYRRYQNLLLTMLIGGIWHGAGWTFVAWGGLHGSFLAINHLWQAFVQRTAFAVHSPMAGFRIVAKCSSWMITFLCVVVGWVFFRSSSIAAAVRMLASMLDMGGSTNAGLVGIWNFAMVGCCMAIVVALPNVYEFMRDYEAGIVSESLMPKGKQSTMSWQPTAILGAISACLFAASVLHLTQVSEFLYFEF